MTSSDFSAAQDRILQRRRQNDEAAAIAARVHPVQQPSTILGLNHIRRHVNTLWQTLESRTGTSPLHRVSQVDAELLDEELITLFKSQVHEALKFYGPNFESDWTDEISFLLRAILFKLSIWDHNASYAAALQNLVYTDARSTSPTKPPPSRAQKAAYGSLTVLGYYAWTKWTAYLSSIENYDDSPQSSYVLILSRLTTRLSTTHSIASFLSFIAFLLNGRYRTLTDRILRLRLTTPASSPNLRREVSFEYLNRQLVWHAFTEFLLFLLPLVGIGKWRRWLSRMWKRIKTVFKSHETAETDQAEKDGPLARLPERTCAICYADANPAEVELLGVNAAVAGGSGVIGSASTDIVNPYETIPCQCIYCFACLATKIEAEEGDGWTCLRCGEIVKSCRAWRGDVVETKETGLGNNKKTVEFVEDNETIADDKA
ncbi:MAG: hypothetical protein Q9160_004154 [Pyrenula sp. 1 TL-2023]